MVAMYEAGHRIEGEHDCFVMNCNGLGPEVLRLQDQIIELDAENRRLQAIIDDADLVHAPAYDPAVFTAEVRGSIRGEVGSLAGTPIIGTNDVVNSGPARALEGVLIAPSDYASIRRPSDPPLWKPAGELGFVTGAGTSVVEEPKNDARPAIKQVGPSRGAS